LCEFLFLLVLHASPIILILLDDHKHI
jgi:hypothetical protein